MALKIFFVFITSFTCITACNPENSNRLSDAANKLWYGDFANFKQWNITSSIRENMREVVKDPLGSGDMVLKVLYPRGSYAGGLPGGTAFVLKMQNTDHASLEYDLLFPQSFDFVKGGKLPGLFSGKRNCTGGDNAYDCFSARYMFGANGTGYPYLYIPKNESHVPEFCAFLGPKYAKECAPSYGYSLLSHEKIKYFTKDKWANLKQTIRLNTPGKANGRLTVWVDGMQKFDFDRIIFRNSDKVKINGILFETFFGGSTSDWASANDVFAFYKNLKFTDLN